MTSPAAEVDEDKLDIDNDTTGVLGSDKVVGETVALEELEVFTLEAEIDAGVQEIHDTEHLDAADIDEPRKEVAEGSLDTLTVLHNSDTMAVTSQRSADNRRPR